MAGQFGIGFNVVYHLTECPSFITGGDALCILDPHCKYVEQATEIYPGGMYENLSQGFWKEFEDMRSAYLRTGLNNLPEELLNGSLFRFPIRHSAEVADVQFSNSYSDFPHTLTPDALSEKMEKWMQLMKEAMFFLNNVTELKYFEIEPETICLHKKFHYKTSVEQSSDLSRDQEMLKTCISNFTEHGDKKPCIIHYQLNLTEMNSANPCGKTEKWLIQLGVGDVCKEHQLWKFVKYIKPKHGIAAPLELDKSTKRLFCLLPLPIKEGSGVPVHVNGSFILNLSRRNLWECENDPRTTWNKHLFNAIASSYARFLVAARECYLKTSYPDWKLALDDIKKYYKLFPTFAISDVKKEWAKLPCQVYQSLTHSNASVLCVLVSRDKSIIVQWHSLISDNPVQQVHFWSQTKNKKIVHPIFQSIGMKITSSPVEVMKCFNAVFEEYAKQEEGMSNSETNYSDAQEKIPPVTPLSVFRYYTEHSELSPARDMEQYPITKTIFKYFHSLC